MKRQMILWAVLLSLLFTACAKAPAKTGTEADSSMTEDAQEETQTGADTEAGAADSANAAADTAATAGDTASETEDAAEAGDRVLSSLSASVDEGRVLRVDAIGHAVSERAGHCAIREIRVYEDGKLLQTISSSEIQSNAAAFQSGNMTAQSSAAGQSNAAAQSNSAASRSGGTAPAESYEAASVEEAAAVLDVNFDGSDDLDLSAWITSYSTLHHYWIWNSGVGRYLYACTLEGAEVNPAKGEIVAKYNTSSVYYTDVYRPAAGGMLALVSRELEDWDRGTEDFPLLERYEYEDGEGVLVHQEFTDYDDTGRTIREVRELVDGVLIPIRLEELEVTDGSIRIIHAEEVPPPQPEIPEEEEFLEEEITDEIEPE